MRFFSTGTETKEKVDFLLTFNHNDLLTAAFLSILVSPATASCPASSILYLLIFLLLINTPVISSYLFITAAEAFPQDVQIEVVGSPSITQKIITKIMKISPLA